MARTGTGVEACGASGAAEHKLWTGVEKTEAVIVAQDAAYGDQVGGPNSATYGEAGRAGETRRGVFRAGAGHGLPLQPQQHAAACVAPQRWLPSAHRRPTLRSMRRWAPAEARPESRSRGLAGRRALAWLEWRCRCKIDAAAAPQPAPARNEGAADGAGGV
jgi:hypothetical protein